MPEIRVPTIKIFDWQQSVFFKLCGKGKICPKKPRLKILHEKFAYVYILVCIPQSIGKWAWTLSMAVKIFVQWNV